MSFFTRFFEKEPLLLTKITELGRELAQAKKTIADQRVEISNLRAQLLLKDK